MSRLVLVNKSNSDLTDWEQIDKNHNDPEEVKRLRNIEAAGYFLNILREQSGNFCMEVADCLEQGKLPYGRGIPIVLEIVAQTAGRKGGQRYKSKLREARREYKKLERLFDDEE